MEKTNNKIIFHAIFIVITFFILFINVLPSLYAASLSFNSDEAFHAREIWELLQGRNFFQYYEEVNYHGIIEGLSAIPFLNIFGFHPVSYKLPAIIFYSLFIWTTFIILRSINPIAGWISTILLIFPPPWIVGNAVILNVPRALILFLGNLQFIYLIRYKLGYGKPHITTFLLAFYSGLAIYAYSYAIIQVFTVALVLILTNAQWKRLRPFLSFHHIIQPFRNLKSKSLVLISIFELIILSFLLAIIYSYIFGGFGVDIGGVTLLQINNLHKPVMQITGLIVLRLALIKAYPLTTVSRIKEKFSSIDSSGKILVITGMIGFVLGMLPRIISILSGSVSRGGQGFDIDLNPFKLVSHFFELISLCIFEVMNFSSVILVYYLDKTTSAYTNLQMVLFVPLALVAGCATLSFMASRWNLIKSILSLKSIKFEPALILLIYPAVLSGSTIITMNGPEIKHLGPLYWSVAVYTSLFLSRVFLQSKFLAFIFIGIWVTFYSSFNLGYNYNWSNWKEIVVQNKNAPIPKVVSFLKSNGIKSVYSGYGVSSEIIFTSNGEIDAAQYSKFARGKSLRAKLEKISNFSIVTSGGHSQTVKEFLRDNNINFKIHQVDKFTIFWSILGDTQKINQLRNLTE